MLIFDLYVYLDKSRTEDVGPGGIVVGSVDELPPPYTSVTGGAPMVTCRVCQVCFFIVAVSVTIFCVMLKFDKIVNIQLTPVSYFRE